MMLFLIFKMQKASPLTQCYEGAFSLIKRGEHQLKHIPFKSFLDLPFVGGTSHTAFDLKDW